MGKLKGLYKRGDIWWLRYAGLDGKTIFESSGTTKQKEAEALLHKRKTEVKEGKRPEVKKIANHTFRDLSQEYRKWCERQKSYSNKVYYIDYLVNEFGLLPLRMINTRVIEQFQTKLIGKGLKPATCNRHLACLKHMFTKAVEWEMVEEAALKGPRRVKFLPENNRRLRYLSPEECQTLIKSCDPHLRPVVITALHSGMRKDEILSLRWDNVDLRHGFILLNQNQTKNSERKEVPINGTLRETLAGVTRRLDVSYVFFDTLTGKRYLDVKRSFHSALKRAGIKDFHFHDLRHTFASHLVMSGVDLPTVSKLLGHKDIKMTLRYAHLAPSHMTKAVDILDRTLNEKSTIQKLYNLEVAK